MRRAVLLTILCCAGCVVVVALPIFRTTCDFSNKTTGCVLANDCDDSMGQMKCAYKPNPHVYVGTWMDSQLQELDDRVTNVPW